MSQDEAQFRQQPEWNHFQLKISHALVRVCFRERMYRVGDPDAAMARMRPEISNWDCAKPVPEPYRVAPGPLARVTLTLTAVLCPPPPFGDRSTNQNAPAA